MSEGSIEHIGTNRCKRKITSNDTNKNKNQNITVVDCKRSGNLEHTATP